MSKNAVPLEEPFHNVTDQEWLEYKKKKNERWMEKENLKLEQKREEAKNSNKKENIRANWTYEEMYPDPPEPWTFTNVTSNLTDPNWYVKRLETTVDKLNFIIYHERTANTAQNYTCYLTPLNPRFNPL